MLYSPSQRIAFAHYPKTAGHSLVTWFRATFPDARFLRPDPVHLVSHLPLRESLDLLGMAPQPLRFLGRSTRNAIGSLASRVLPFAKPSPRIIGVVREPMSMLVSLYEYWKHYDFGSQALTPLIMAARSGCFRTFLHRAVVRRDLPRYENFFDVGGAAWNSTRLLDFDTLEESLGELVRDWDLPAPSTRLERRNVGPRRVQDLTPYEQQAAALTAVARSYFGWYYRRGSHTADHRLRVA